MTTESGKLRTDVKVESKRELKDPTFPRELSEDPILDRKPSGIYTLLPIYYHTHIAICHMAMTREPV